MRSLLRMALQKLLFILSALALGERSVPILVTQVKLLDTQAPGKAHGALEPISTMLIGTT